MEETQKSSYLSLGIFLKLLSRYTRKDKAIAEKRFLGANNTVDRKSTRLNSSHPK